MLIYYIYRTGEIDLDLTWLDVLAFSRVVAGSGEAGGWWLGWLLFWSRFAALAPPTIRSWKL